MPCGTDPLPCPEHADLVEHKLVAAIFLKEPGNRITLKTGTKLKTIKATEGFHLVEVDLSAGQQEVVVHKGRKEILHSIGKTEVTPKPKDIWNYNLHVQTAS